MQPLFFDFSKKIAETIDFLYMYRLDYKTKAQMN